MILYVYIDLVEMGGVNYTRSHIQTEVTIYVQLFECVPKIV